MYRFITKMIHYFNELQENNLCIINFKRYNTPSDQLFKEKNILKISGFVKRKMQNLLEMFAKRESIYSIFTHRIKTTITQPGPQITTNLISLQHKLLTIQRMPQKHESKSKELVYLLY